MSIRSLFCKLVLLAVLSGVAILPCVPAQAAGFPGPSLESSSSWFMPILDWLGWGAEGDEAILGLAQSGTRGDLQGTSTSSLDTSSADTGTTEEDDDRSPNLDPNG